MRGSWRRPHGYADLRVHAKVMPSCSTATQKTRTHHLSRGLLWIHGLPRVHQAEPGLPRLHPKRLGLILAVGRRLARVGRSPHGAHPGSALCLLAVLSGVSVRRQGLGTRHSGRPLVNRTGLCRLTQPHAAQREGHGATKPPHRRPVVGVPTLAQTRAFMWVTLGAARLFLDAKCRLCRASRPKQRFENRPTLHLILSCRLR